jgi:hypothetical protein
MRTILLRTTAFLLLSVLGLSACKKQVVNQAFSATYTINISNWGTTDGKSYSTSLQMKELNNTVVQSGGVLVYLSFDNGTTFEAIPEVYQGISYGTYHQNNTVFIDYYNTNGTAASLPGGVVLAKIVLLNAKPL